MITESFGKEILGFLEKNQTVLVSMMVGSRGLPKNINRGSLVFVSISFIVLMIISSAWLIFYFIQKIRDTSARDRSQVLHNTQIYQPSTSASVFSCCSVEQSTHKHTLTLKLASKNLARFFFQRYLWYLSGLSDLQELPVCSKIVVNGPAFPAHEILMQKCVRVCVCVVTLCLFSVWFHTHRLIVLITPL